MAKLTNAELIREVESILEDYVHEMLDQEEAVQQLLHLIKPKTFPKQKD